MRTQQTAKHRSDQRPGVSACQVLKTRTEPYTSWGPHLLTWVYLLGLKRNVWTYPTRRYITIESKSINENPADCQTQVRPASRRFCMSSFENPDGASHVLGTSFIDLESFAWAQKKRLDVPYTAVYRNRIQVNKCEHSSLPDTSPTVGLDYLHGVCAQLVLKNRNSLTRPGGLIY